MSYYVTTVKLAYFRSLMSQSAASLTMGSIAALLRENGIGAEICLFERGNPHNLEQIFAAGEVIIIAKPNFKDISEMIKLLQFAKTDKAITHIFFADPMLRLMQKASWKNWDG